MAVAAKQLEGPSTGDAQGASLFDFVEATLLAAGYTRLLTSTTHGTGDTRSALYRFPPLDPYDSDPSVCYLVAPDPPVIAQGIWSPPTWDCDIQEQSGTSPISVSRGELLSNGSWPTGSSPNNETVTSTSFQDWNVEVGTGLESLTYRCLASEYGFVVTCQRGDSSYRVAAQFRPMGGKVPPRDIRFLGALTSGSWPVTFGAPSGAQHLIVTVEGVNFPVTFDTTRSMSPFDVAQEITRELGGFGEAYVVDRASGSTDDIAIRIPPERAPSGNYSVTGKGGRIELTYQDPTVVTARLDFTAFRGTVTAVTTGAGGTLQKSGANWVTAGVRVGATIYNHGVGSSAIVTGYATTSTQDDTLVLDTVPGTWTNAHTYDGLPLRMQHDGVGAHGGTWIGTRLDDPTAVLTAGGSVDVVLNDLYGEAQGHYEVGQHVLTSSNGCAVLLTLGGISGTFSVGEVVTDDTTGATGIIRGFTGSVYVVDCTGGASAAATKPWTVSFGITGAGGATATISSIATFTDAGVTVGWIGLVEVTAIGQVDPGNGDYRTVLTCDFGGSVVNPSIELFPGFVVGVRGKVSYGHAMNLASAIGSAGTSRLVPGVLTTPVFTGYSETISSANKAEENLSVVPFHEPDYETHQLQLAEVSIEMDTTSGGFQEIENMGPAPHLRFISTRGTAPSRPQPDDVVLEDRDANRPWHVTGETTATSFGVGRANQFFCIGPGYVP